VNRLFIRPVHMHKICSNVRERVRWKGIDQVKLGGEQGTQLYRVVIKYGSNIVTGWFLSYL
jgi:hypothetical protein